MDTVEQALQQLSRRRKLIQGGILLVGAGILVSLAVGMGFKQMVAAIAILAAVLLAHFFVVRRAIKEYNQAYLQEIIRHGVCKEMENLVVARAGGLSREEFRGLAMFPLHDAADSFISRNCFRGRKEGMELIGAEVTFHYPVPGEKRQKYEFLSGTLYMTTTPAENPKGDWLLLSRGLLKQEQEQKYCQNSGYRRLPSDESTLSEEYRVYTRGGEIALDPQLEKQLEKTIKEVGRPSAIRMSPQGAAIFVNHWFYTGNGRPPVNPTREDLTRNIFPAQRELCRLFRWWIRG